MHAALSSFIVHRLSKRRGTERKRERERNRSSQNLRQPWFILLSSAFLGLNWIAPTNELIPRQRGPRVRVIGWKGIKDTRRGCIRFANRPMYLIHGISNKNRVQSRIPCNAFFTVNRPRFPARSFVNSAAQVFPSAQCDVGAWRYIDEVRRYRGNKRRIIMLAYDTRFAARVTLEVSMYVLGLNARLNLRKLQIQM